MLDLFNNQVVSVDIQRDHGFLEGMGIDPGSKTQNGQGGQDRVLLGGGEYQIACHQPTQGAIDGGRTAMENCLSANPDINVVYAINEPAAEGAYNALKAAGKQNDVRHPHDRRQLQGREVRSRAVSSPLTRRSTRARWQPWASTAIAKLAAGGTSPRRPPARRSSTPARTSYRQARRPASPARPPTRPPRPAGG